MTVKKEEKPVEKSVEKPKEGQLLDPETGKPIEGAIIVDEGTPPVTKPPEGGTFEPNPLWKELDGVEGFEMPKDVTAENEMGLLKDNLVKFNLAKAPEEIKKEGVIVDPEYKAFLDWKTANPDGTLDKFVSEKSGNQRMLELDGSDFMREHLIQTYGKHDPEKNPLGLTEDQINDYIQSLEENKTLPLEVLKAKKEYSAKQVPQTQANTNGTVEKVMEKDLLGLFEKTGQYKDLNGIELSKAEIDEINTNFKSSVLPDKQNKVKIVEMMQNDEMLWKFFAFNYLGEKKMKEKLFSTKDTTKDQIYEKLGLKPVASGKQATPGKTNIITPSKWASPEGVE